VDSGLCEETRKKTKKENKKQTAFGNHNAVWISFALSNDSQAEATKLDWALSLRPHTPESSSPFA